MAFDSQLLIDMLLNSGYFGQYQSSECGNIYFIDISQAKSPNPKTPSFHP